MTLRCIKRELICARELVQMKTEVRSEIEIKMVQLDQKLEKQARDLEDKIQLSKTETLLMLESKQEQLEQTMEQKIENNRVLWRELASDLSSDDNNLTIAVDKRIENKMNTMSKELNTTRDIIHTARMEANEEREKERRKNNIVIYRVPESSTNLLKDRSVEDTKTIMKFFNEGLTAGVDEQDILKVMRLGRFSDINQSDSADGSTPHVRPLLVSFNNYSISLNPLVVSSSPSLSLMT